MFFVMVLLVETGVLKAREEGNATTAVVVSAPNHSAGNMEDFMT